MKGYLRETVWVTWLMPGEDENESAKQEGTITLWQSSVPWEDWR